MRLARHIGVTPDWFDRVHPAWLDAAAVMLQLDAITAKGPQVTTWTRGEKRPTLD